MKRVSLEVNGKKVSKDVPDHTLLSVFLRDILNLTGTHVGCDTSHYNRGFGTKWKNASNARSI